MSRLQFGIYNTFASDALNVSKRFKKIVNILKNAYFRMFMYENSLLHIKLIFQFLVILVIYYFVSFQLLIGRSPYCLDRPIHCILYYVHCIFLAILNARLSNFY